MKTKKTSNKSSAWQRSVFYGSCTFLFLWGFALRAVELLNRNFLFGLDNGRDFLAAYSIVVRHKLTLIGAEAGSGVAGINGIFHGPGYFYLISLAFALFHGDPFGAEIFMVVFGLAALAAAAWVGYKVMGKLGSILFLFFTAVSPLIVSQSRFIWSSHPLTVFVILTMYFVYRIGDNPRVFAPLAVFTAGFTYNSQLGVAVPLTAAVLLSIPVVYQITDLSVYLTSLAALVFAFAPMGLFEIRHHFMAVHSAISYIHGGGSGASGSLFEAKRLMSHIQDYLNNFYNTFAFEFGWIPNAVQLVVLKISIPFVLYGLTLVGGKQLRRFILFLFLCVAVTWAGYLFLNNVVWDYYLTHTRIAFILLFTLGGIGLYRHRGENLLTKASLGVYLILLLTVGVGSVFRMYISYTQDIHDNNVIDKIKGKHELIDMMYKDAKGKPFSVFVFEPGIYTYAYDYLFMTYGVNKYGYKPTAVKHGLAYLVIEPDRNQPWRQNGWLETVVQGGTILWQKTLFNGGVIFLKKLYP